MTVLEASHRLSLRVDRIFKDWSLETLCVMFTDMWKNFLLMALFNRSITNM
jgi:hypothetical protein